MNTAAMAATISTSMLKVVVPAPVVGGGLAGGASVGGGVGGAVGGSVGGDDGREEL
eukprot:gene4433-biopygen12600